MADGGSQYVNILTGKAALAFTLLTTTVLSCHLALTSATMSEDARAILSQSYLDARWLYAAGSIAGLAYTVHFRSERLRATWIVLLGLCCLGRGLDLLFVGDPIIPRSLEIRGAVAWLLMFMLGVVCALLLTAYSLLHTEHTPWGDEHRD